MSRDRFEAMMQSASHEARDGMGKVVLLRTAIHRMRLEQYALVRAVKRLKHTECERMNGGSGHYHRACLDVLSLLAKRKGKP